MNRFIQKAETRYTLWTRSVIKRTGRSGGSENLSLREAMQRLSERERNIIEMRFYEGKTQMEVAQEVGISQAQVSRLEKNALKSMKNFLRP